MRYASSRLRQRLRHHDRRTVALWAVGHLAVRFAKPALRLRSEPGIADLARICPAMDTTAEAVLERCWPLSGEEMDKLRTEFDRVAGAVAARYDADLPYRSNWAVERQTAFLLFGLVRLHQPAVVVETGVANGHSSSILLAALRANGHGRLYSYDISSDVGRLVPAEDRDRWELVVGGAADPETGLVQMLERIGAGIDVFFHDADHSYLGQMFEFMRAWPRLTPGGFLVSDDIDRSHAFGDFAQRTDRVPTVLLDGRKALGLLRR